MYLEPSVSKRFSRISHRFTLFHTFVFNFVRQHQDFVFFRAQFLHGAVYLAGLLASRLAGTPLVHHTPNAEKSMSSVMSALTYENP